MKLSWLKSRWAVAAGVCVLTAASYAQLSGPDYDIPAYHPSAPLRVSALPPILHGAALRGPEFRYQWQVDVYKKAAKIGSVLYQLPCYCRCDRELGHTSLRSCFEGLHGAECGTCAREAAFAYQQTRRGQSPAQIRAEIEQGAFQSIDLMAQ